MKRAQYKLDVWRQALGDHKQRIGNYYKHLELEKRTASFLDKVCLLLLPDTVLALLATYNYFTWLKYDSFIAMYDNTTAFIH